MATKTLASEKKANITDIIQLKGMNDQFLFESEYLCKPFMPHILPNLPKLHYNKTRIIDTIKTALDHDSIFINQSLLPDQQSHPEGFLVDRNSMYPDRIMPLFASASIPSNNNNFQLQSYGINYYSYSHLEEIKTRVEKNLEYLEYRAINQELTLLRRLKKWTRYSKQIDHIIAMKKIARFNKRNNKKHNIPNVKINDFSILL
jgi:hypothetical protein